MFWVINEVVFCCWCIIGYDFDEKIIFKFEFYCVFKIFLIGNFFLNDLKVIMYYLFIKCILVV